MKKPAPNFHRWIASVVVVVCLETGELCGQRLSEAKNEAGVVDYIYYGGESDWLVAQEDPRSHWHKLPELEMVTFHNFAVSGEALRYVLSLKQLKGFDLGYTAEGVEVDTKDLDQLREAHHLEYLSLCLPDIGNDHLRFLPEMKSLVSLSVEYLVDPNQKARFTDPVALQLAAAPRLSSIKIHSDKFTDEFIRLLSSKRELESLEIASPHFTDASLVLIGRFANLRKLRIRSPNLTDEGVRALSSLAQLEELEIESPLLTSASLESVSGLSRLSYLDLSMGSAGREELALLQKLKSLKILALRSARIGDAEFSALRDHPSIESIFMGQAELTEESLPVIASLKQLSCVKFGTKTPESRQLLKVTADRGIQDVSFYPKEK